MNYIDKIELKHKFLAEFGIVEDKHGCYIDENIEDVWKWIDNYILDDIKPKI